MSANGPHSVDRFTGQASPLAVRGDRRPARPRLPLLNRDPVFVPAELPGAGLSGLERKTLRKTFRDLGEARAWRQESQVAIRKGLLRSPSQLTLQEAAEEWLNAAERGLVRTRSGETYKPARGPALTDKP